MPIVQISIVEGRDPAAVKRCVKEVARTVHQTLGAPLDTIRVMVSRCRLHCGPWGMRRATKSTPARPLRRQRKPERQRSCVTQAGGSGG